MNTSIGKSSISHIERLLGTLDGCEGEGFHTHDTSPTVAGENHPPPLTCSHLALFCPALFPISPYSPTTIRLNYTDAKSRLFMSSKLGRSPAELPQRPAFLPQDSSICSSVRPLHIFFLSGSQYPQSLADSRLSSISHSNSAILHPPHNMSSYLHHPLAQLIQFVTCRSCITVCRLVFSLVWK